MASIRQNALNSAVEGRTHQSSIYVDIWVQFDGCDLGCNAQIPDFCMCTHCFSLETTVTIGHIWSHAFTDHCF